jgi:hypothetical protein
MTIAGDYTQVGGLTTVSGDGELDVAGLLDNQGGQLLLQGGTVSAVAGLQNDPGGALTGYGTIVADVSNAGTIDILGPGPYGIGMLSIQGNTSAGVQGDFTQVSGGVLTMAIAGSAPSLTDQLMIAGLASWGGDLDVNVAGGFTPSTGQLFTLMSYGSYSGQFDQVNTPSVPGVSLIPLSDAPPGNFSLGAVGAGGVLSTGAPPPPPQA